MCSNFIIRLAARLKVFVRLLKRTILLVKSLVIKLEILFCEKKGALDIKWEFIGGFDFNLHFVKHSKHEFLGLFLKIFVLFFLALLRILFRLIFLFILLLAFDRSKISCQRECILIKLVRLYARVISGSEFVRHIELLQMDVNIAMLVNIIDQALMHLQSLIFQEQTVEKPCALLAGAFRVQGFFGTHFRVCGVVHVLYDFSGFWSVLKA